MKLYDERYQWMYDHCNDLKRALVTWDYFKHHTSEVYQRVIEKEFPDAIPTDYTDK